MVKNFNVSRLKVVSHIISTEINSIRESIQNNSILILKEALNNE